MVMEKAGRNFSRAETPPLQQPLRPSITLSITFATKRTPQQSEHAINVHINPVLILIRPRNISNQATLWWSIIRLKHTPSCPTSSSKTHLFPPLCQHSERHNRSSMDQKHEHIRLTSAEIESVVEMIEFATVDRASSCIGVPVLSPRKSPS